MKQLFIALAATVVCFSCKNSPEQATSTDQAAIIENAKKEVIDSINAVNEAKTTQRHARQASREESAPVINNAGGNTSSTAGTTAATAPVTQKKKGWSHTAKGAVVGAGTGAITGAIVNKDRVKGAAIGTVIGTGVGAGIGAIVDHEKKKKQAAQ